VSPGITHAPEFSWELSWVSNIQEAGMAGVVEDCLGLSLQLANWTLWWLRALREQKRKL